MNVTRVLHLITGLPVGGAQMMLLKLLSRTDRSALQPEVVSLLERGPVGATIEQLGIRVRALHLSMGVPALVGAFRLVHWLRQDPPDILHCWMYHADFAGGLAGRLVGIRNVIWGIRQSAPDPRGTKRTTLWVVKACARLSRTIPARIVCCSEVSRRDHVALGYDPAKMTVIPNGFDLESFSPDAVSYLDVRRELGIPAAAQLVGLVARFHPQKDHASFLHAAGEVAQRFPETHFLLCGEGVGTENRALAERIASEGLGGRVHLLGERGDVARLTSALDVACSSSSFAEGFPNSIGEAMTCAVPCVVTDVGDSAELVGNTGRVVPPERPGDLAHQISVLLAAAPEERQRLGDAARKRIADRYSLSTIAERYDKLYREVLAS